MILKESSGYQEELIITIEQDAILRLVCFCNEYVGLSSYLIRLVPKLS